MASDDKKTKTSPTPKDESLPKNKGTSNVSAAKAKGGEETADLSYNYSRGEGQKPVSKAYKDNWNAIGQGMGAALNTASALNAYVLSDRGTWLAFKNRGDLAIAVEGDKRLFNQYGVMLVNPAKHPSVKTELGQQFIDWLISPEGQNVIAGYKIDSQ